ncbi:MAG: peptidoglycan DD-metalloendopeptidase family protein [Deltaproteobacteria bacterium]|nr:peptidoglycan DD-metalloendopeptidase family protein [Deltaproteobacteria bacterium]
MIDLFLIISLVMTGSIGKYKILTENIRIEQKSIKKYLEIWKENKNLSLAISVSNAERASLIKRKDTTVIRIRGFERSILKKQSRIKKLTAALSKLHQSSWGRPFFSGDTVTVPSDGRYGLRKILLREINELMSLKTDVLSLEKRKHQLEKSIVQIENLVVNLRLRLNENESELARLKFAYDTAHTKREKIGKEYYDAVIWKIHSEIRKIHKTVFEKHNPFRLKRGVLLRPVSGAFMRDKGISNGVFISARPGDKVFSPEDGVVKFTGHVSGYGQVVVIEHRDGYFSLIGKLHEISVKEKQAVKRGHIIARVAPLARAPYVPVYYEIRKGTRFLNARLWLN